MNNVQKYAITSIIIAVSSSIATYAFTTQNDPLILIEKENKRTSRECLNRIDYESTSIEIQKAITACGKLEMKKIVDPNILNATGSKVPVPSQWYTSKHSLILTGYHSYVKYSDRKWASWKNNNPSWLTWGVSNTLKDHWTKAGIRYRIGSPRPANEKGNYIYFETVEDGLRAKIIAIRERWGTATVAHYLGGWGTDDLKLSFDKSKIISELTDWEFTELFIQQMKKESPGYVNQLVLDKILIIQ